MKKILFIVSLLIVIGFTACNKPKVVEALPAVSTEMVMPAAPVVVEEPVVVETTLPPVVREPYKVVWGDTLWDLSTKYYGDPWKYTKLVTENKVKNPNLIVVGITLKIPE